MSTRNILKPIVGFLTVLGLDTDRIPSVSEYRSAYRAKLHLHPDKAGVESTSEFQKVTEAAEAVLDFVTANSKPDDVNNDNDVLIRLVKSNDLAYKQQSISLILANGEVVAWMHEF